MNKKIAICLLMISVPAFSFAAAGLAVIKYTLNGTEADTTINPTTKKDDVLNISIDVDRSVKLTRVYFCPENDTPECKNYIKYISPNTEGTTVTAVWDGYKTGGSAPADLGNYWMRVLLKEGSNDSVSVGLTSHKIIIGEVVNASSSTTTDNNDNSSSTPQATSSTNSGTGSSVGGMSTHSSQADLTSAEVKAPSVGAGRKRYVTTGTTVVFDAWTQNADNFSSNYFWSFGDGTSAVGSKVSHAYSFPGSYNVVLNANFNGKEAVSRTVVVVDEPQVRISTIDPVGKYFELENLSNTETNIEGWLLGNDREQFQFPKDTIINAKTKIKIPIAITRLTDFSSGVAQLYRSDGLVVSQHKMMTNLPAGLGTSTINTRDLSNLLSQMETEVRGVGERVKMRGITVADGALSEPASEETEVKANSATSSGQNTIVLKRQPGLFARGLGFLRALFP